MRQGNKASGRNLVTWPSVSLPMKRALLSMCCVLMLVGLAAAEDKPDKPWVAGKSAHTSFAARGEVLMRLGAGDATVISDPNAKEITVTTETKGGEKQNEIKTDVRITGTYAEIHVDGPNNGFRYKITLPTAARLKVRMSAGDLNISGVDGDVDVNLHAGDCNIQLGTGAENFGPVDLSVNAGDVNGEPFNANKSGLFRHFKNEKASKYRFHAHGGAGDLNVTSRK
jgi:hypothetical protein